MTEHDLKEMKNLGAELGAAKAEVERLREALRPFAAFEAVRSKQGGCTPKSGTVWAVASSSEEAEITVEHLQAAVSALSQQAEPVRSPRTEDTASMDSNSEQEQFTAVDMATAAAQGFRDGQAAVAPATAHDEREAFKRALHSQKVFKLSSATIDAAEWAWFHRPAQAEQQPVAWRRVVERLIANVEILDQRPRSMCRDCADCNGVCESGLDCDIPRLIEEARAMLAAPIAQTAPQPEQSGLVAALEYYANGDHLLLADPDEWDTCSGEPANFLHDEAGTASVEDGSIAKVALEAYRAAMAAKEA